MTMRSATPIASLSRSCHDDLLAVFVLVVIVSVGFYLSCCHDDLLAVIVLVVIVSVGFYLSFLVVGFYFR